MQITVGCAQFAPKKAHVEENLDRVAAHILAAAGAGVRVVCFAEAIVSGYFLEGGVLDCALEADELLEKLRKRLPAELDIDVVLGFYESRGEVLFNSAAYLEFLPGSARVVHVYQKFFLPTYGVFDEERFVSSGNEVGAFDTRFGKSAMLICEDVWHSIMPTICAVQGTQILYVPSASPARGFKGDRPANMERWEKLLSSICEEHSIYCLNSMLVGFEGGKGFGGGSSITGPDGALLASSPIFEESLLVTQIDLEHLRTERARSPLLGDLRSRWSQLINQAQRAIPPE